MSPELTQPQGHRRKRRRERRNQFLDVEAEVDEDEDENDDDEDELDEIKNNFIADTHPDDLADLPEGGERDDRRHRELDRRREMEASLDAEKQAEILRQRYATKNRAGRAMGDSAVVPKRLLLPSVDDPSIWAVRCKEGKGERGRFLDHEAYRRENGYQGGARDHLCFRARRNHINHERIHLR